MTLTVDVFLRKFDKITHDRTRMFLSIGFRTRLYGPKEEVIRFEELVGGYSLVTDYLSCNGC